MKKIIALVATLLALDPLGATQYFGIDAGLNNAEPHNSSNHGLKMGMVVAVKYGYTFTTGLRAEAEIAYRYNNFKTKYNVAHNDDFVISKAYQSFHSWAYMVNGLYDVANLNVYDITPYFGVGIGYCQNTLRNKFKSQTRSTIDKEKDNRFAYQGIIGAKYAINSTLSSAVEYHYFCGKSHAKEHSVHMSVIRNF
jgi:opacity protein-like surface antigen